jgi:uncharacterized protein
MRRKDREITDQKEIDKIIQDCEVCYLGLSDGSEPYVVPLNFGFENNTIYFHSAPDGRKLDFIKQNKRVCIAFTSDYELVIEGKPQEWTTHYTSAIAYGEAEIITDPVAKQKGINVLIGKYSNRDYEFSPEVLAAFTIIKVTLTEKSGKSSRK